MNDEQNCKEGQMLAARGLLGRHLSNISDHRRPHADKLFCYCSRDDPQARYAAWASHLDWINRNRIGPPKATDSYTVEQLEAFGMIGIYAPPS